MDRKYKVITALLTVLILLGLIASALLYTKMHRAVEPEVPQVQPTEPPPENKQTECAYAGRVVINEFMEKNRTVIADADGDFSDWIEVKNLSEETVDLTAWSVSDKPGKGWTLPETKLESGGLLLIFASGKDRCGDELHTDFKLSGDETVYLTDASGALCDKADCGGCEKDVSMARTESGDLAQSRQPTPGFENSPEGYLAYQESLSAKGPLVISEAVTYNAGSLVMEDGTACDWAELKNISAEPVRLSDYYLSDDKDDLRLFQLPDKTLMPGELFVVICDKAEHPGITNRVIAPFELNSANEQLYLTRGDGILTDCVCLRSIPYACSYGRQDGKNGWFYFPIPTPGEDNFAGCRRVSEKPVGLTKDGVYDNVKGVTAELAGSGVIRYTLDDSLPDLSSPVYKEPITMEKTTVLRAVCFEDGAVPSSALTQTFIINEGHSVPVLSLTTDDIDEFRIMYDGRIKHRELPGCISLYAPDGGFTINCGISLNGETSLSLPKKNMSLRFRGAYGDETLKYDIYKGGVAEFTNLLLRAGQDFNQAIVRNELCQELCARVPDSRIINQRSIYCVLYVNGEYTGIYTLKEKANEQLYASLCGVSRESVQLAEADVPIDSEFYKNVVWYAMMHDMSDEDCYEYFCGMVDIDSVIDWILMESFCSNVDLTSGNLRYVRSSENDNKWRLMFYDLDSTFNTTAGMYITVLSEYAKENRQVGALMYPLVANASFRKAMLERASELMSTVLTEDAILEELDEQTAIIAPEVARDQAQFGRTEAQWKDSVETIRSLVKDTPWVEVNIDTLCRIFNVTAEERELYFGAMEKTAVKKR